MLRYETKVTEDLCATLLSQSLAFPTTTVLNIVYHYLVIKNSFLLCMNP